MVTEAARVAESAEAGHRPPRRHEPLAGHEGDHPVPAFRVVVPFQREGRDAALPVAFDAVGLQQRCDVAVVGDLVETRATRGSLAPVVVKAPDCLSRVGLQLAAVGQRLDDGSQVMRGDLRP